MASLQAHGNGRFRVRYYLHGKHRGLNLPRCTKKQAQSICEKVARLIESALTGEPPAQRVHEWLGHVGDELHGRLVAAGLAGPRLLRERSSKKLDEFIDEYIAEQTTSKSTIKNLNYAKDKLIAYFGDRDLRVITPGDADRWLQQLDCAETTKLRFLGAATAFFRSAYRLKLIDENPFEDMRRPSRKNSARQAFVEQETIEKVIACCVDQDVRLSLALARYGGLRHSSETFLLTWGDVNWSEGRIRITSPKTEKVGKSERVAPLFPELRPYLAAAFEAAPDGATYCINNRRTGSVLYWVERAIKAAGVEKWPKRFQNLRSSRQTELEQNGHPTHVVCQWLGNTEKIAKDHYLQVTDADFAAALDRPAAATVRN